MRNADLEHNLIKDKNIYVHIFFIPFSYSGIPDLALGILKMLIRVYFVMYYNQHSNYYFLAWYDFQPVCSVNVQHVQ